MDQLVWAAIGSLGFGLIFKVNKNKLILVALAGFLNFGAYFITFNYTSSVFMASAMGAFVTLIYSDFMARMVKCPSTVFILPGLIPSVPGASIFYMMQNIVLGNNDVANNYGIEAFQTVMGIMFGFAIASVVFLLFENILNSIIKLKQ